MWSIVYCLVLISDVEQGMLPWLMENVVNEVNRYNLSRKLIDAMLRDVTKTRKDAYDKLEESIAAELASKEKQKAAETAAAAAAAAAAAVDDTTQSQTNQETEKEVLWLFVEWKDVCVCVCVWERERERERECDILI